MITTAALPGRSRDLKNAGKFLFLKKWAGMLPTPIFGDKEPYIEFATYKKCPPPSKIFNKYYIFMINNQKFLRINYSYYTIEYYGIISYKFNLPTIFIYKCTLKCQIKASPLSFLRSNFGGP